jgi:phosphoribosylformimino-5-aminoimidazole carboxamide ribotide isomerase
VRGRRLGRVILYPAIDIRDGHAVRLMRGDYEQETVYDADPLDAARRWTQDGARFVHVVDLDGAREGRPVNLEHVRRIAGELEVPVQLGGGLRGARSVAEALEAGAARVVLGTAAVARPELVAAMVEQHGDRILASVDARGGRVSVAGWTEMTGAEPPSIVQDLSARGVERFVFTPVEVDGTMEGPALDELRSVAEATHAELIYSGGIGSVDDLARLRELRLPNLGGVIVGRALYEGRFTVAEGQAALD